MKHTFRKYLSTRGSALFMVLSTMSALLILVMAMYFSVVSSRTVQYAVFNQEQSYQSATSLYDAIAAAVKTGKFLDGKLVSMLPNVGDKISAKGNDYKSLSTTGTKEEDDQIGAYTVDIERLADEKIGTDTYFVYDIAITTTVDGVSETIHTYMRYKDGDYEVKEPGEDFFTATGYIPNDVWINEGFFDSDMYFDAEYVLFGATSAGGLTYKSNITCAGSATFNYGSKPSSDEPLTWVFGNDLTVRSNFAGNLDLCGNAKQNGRILVGGDLYFEDNSWFSFGNASHDTDIYVLGDAYIKNVGGSYGNLFCAGNIYVLNDNDINIHGTVYCNGSFAKTNGGTPAGTREGVDVWMSSGSYGEHDQRLTISEAKEFINTKIGGSTFPKWEVNTNNANDAYYCPEVLTNKITVKFNSYYQPIDGIDPKFTHEVTYSESNKGCTIEDIMDINPGSLMKNDFAFVIDTGDDVHNVFTIRVEANRDWDSTTGNETFVWYPKKKVINADGTTGWDEDCDSSRRMDIIVKGRGSVVIDVPPNVTYQSSDQEFFGHQSWFALMGGVVEDTSVGDGVNSYPIKLYNGASLDKTGFQDTIKDEEFIHTDCDAGECSYTKVSSYNRSSKEYEDAYICDYHGYGGHTCPIPAKDKNDHWITVDLYGYDEPSEEITEDSTGHKVCPCNGRINKSKIEAYANAHPSVKANMDGMPTVNIFIVSVDESANIRIATYEDGSRVQINPYFGYIYAPYMTYMGIGDGSSGLKVCGGLIVSDYVIADHYSYIYARPEIDITDLMSAECLENLLVPTGDRSWRVYGH